MASIHAPRRGRQPPSSMDGDAHGLQSTPPRRGRPKPWSRPRPWPGVNPRPRAGGDRRGRAADRGEELQSTPPRRGRLKLPWDRRAGRFNPAPAQGATERIHQPHASRPASFHAPAQGADRPEAVTSWKRPLQSTPPRRGRRDSPDHSSGDGGSIHPPRRGRRFEFSFILSCQMVLQSTPPRRGATGVTSWVRTGAALQSTPRAGGDLGPSGPWLWDWSFIHAPAQGRRNDGRKEAFFFWLHPRPRAGGRLRPVRAVALGWELQSTPRAGGDS